MSPTTRIFAGILFLGFITIEFGGHFLVTLLKRTGPAISPTSLAYRLFVAGHAHAGVLSILALASLPYVDQLTVAPASQMAIRVCMASAPLLMPAGFFGAGAKTRDDKPGPLIALTYVGALVLAAGLGMLGVNLFRV
jgi:hypothetical protein